MSVPRQTKRCGEIPGQELHSGRTAKETEITVAMKSSGPEKSKDFLGRGETAK